MATFFPPFLRRCSTALGTALVAATALLATACGSVGGTTVESGVGAQAPLPTLPSVAEEDPGRFDGSGCLETSADGECAATADELDRQRAGSGEDSWRTLAGFVGSRWLDTPVAGGPLLLDDSVTTATAGAWWGIGLVRNEGADTVPGVTVAATLVDDAGEVIEVVEVPAAVSAVRSGEPVPFRVDSAVDATQVAEVRWSVATNETYSATGRDVAIHTYWTRGFADPRPVDNYLWRDDGGAHSHLVMGSAEAITTTGQSPRVVGAWIAPDGRVLHVAEAVVVHPDAALDLDSLSDPLVDDELVEAVEGESDSNPAAPTTNSSVLGSTTTRTPSTELDSEPSSTTTIVATPATSIAPATTLPDYIPSELTSGSAADFLLVVAVGDGPTSIDGAVLYLWSEA